MNKSMLESYFLEFLKLNKALEDPSHDELHIRRVVSTAQKLGVEEHARLDILFVAAWLHDCVYVEKNDPKRKLAAVLSAEKAGDYLRVNKLFSESDIEEISHCIAAHSFSGNVEPITLEAKILRDADRLDALGAIGIMRCFSVGARMETKFYHAEEPFPVGREADDSSYSIDHFYAKLFKLQDHMFSDSGKKEALRRTQFMKNFLDELKTEV